MKKNKQKGGAVGEDLEKVRLTKGEEILAGILVRKDTFRQMPESSFRLANEEGRERNPRYS